MIKLNDYLYNGDTVLKILFRFAEDLRSNAMKEDNEIDRIHCNFMLQMSELLTHNEFLTSQSQRIREFYDFMVENYPALSFTFKGRIKSLIRAEEKFNGNIVGYIHDYYNEYNSFPTVPQIKKRLSTFRDLIAYRIVISIPKYQIEDPVEREKKEIELLYEIANQLPLFLENRGFSAEVSGSNSDNKSQLLNEYSEPYYRDYILNPNIFGYQSLHITFYDNIARCFLELQLRTKSMDDIAEIGSANHIRYEKHQSEIQSKRDIIPRGESIYYDEAYDRVVALHNLELKNIDVNMFYAVNNSLINDGCGLFRGRQILPFEHLSRFQNRFL